MGGGANEILTPQVGMENGVVTHPAELFGSYSCVQHMTQQFYSWSFPLKRRKLYSLECLYIKIYSDSISNGLKWESK